MLFELYIIKSVYNIYKQFTNGCKNSENMKKNSKKQLLTAVFLLLKTVTAVFQK